MPAFLRRHQGSLLALVALVALASVGCGEAEPFREPAIIAYTSLQSDAGDEPVTGDCLFFGGADGWGAGGNIEHATPEGPKDSLWLRSRVVSDRMDVVAFTGPVPDPDLPLPGDPGTAVLAERSVDVRFAMERDHDEFEFEHRDRQWLVELDGVGETTSCFPQP